MLALQKKTVRRAVFRTKHMLERNADPCETFNGVLNRNDVRALRTLLSLGESFLRRGTRITRRTS